MPAMSTIHARSLGADRRAAVRHAQRASGQAAAVASMIGDGRPFADVAQQLLAARGSLDALLLRLVELELHDCLPGVVGRNQVDAVMRVALGRTGRATHRNGRASAANGNGRPEPGGTGSRH